MKQEIKTEYNVDIDYPLAQFIVCCGFFLILIVEQLVSSMQDSWTGQREEREPLLRAGTPGVSYQSTAPTIAELPDDVHHPTDGHGHSHLSHPALQQTSLRSVMLLLALSLHSVFEGVAIGLQDNSSQLLSLFIAVIVHKAVMAFSLGLNIAQSSLSQKNFVISNVIFSLASPLGLLLGMAMEGFPASLSNDICSGVLQGQSDI